MEATSGRGHSGGDLQGTAPGTVEVQTGSGVHVGPPFEGVAPFFLAQGGARLCLSLTMVTALGRQCHPPILTCKTLLGLPSAGPTDGTAEGRRDGSLRASRVSTHALPLGPPSGGFGVAGTSIRDPTSEAALGILALGARVAPGWHL